MPGDGSRLPMSITRTLIPTHYTSHRNQNGNRARAGAIVMKTLSSADDLASIRNRISLIRSTDARLWGTMSVHQMLCHLTDAFAYPLGERDVPPFKSLPIPTFLFKWIALSLPREWPRGIPTPPEVDQRIGGTPPTEFEVNRAALLTALDRLAADVKS